jgi:hypothetical protein
VGEVKRRAGVPLSLGSCHTSEIAGYAVEGHVPAEDVRRLILERPVVAGIAVPGMPSGAPGMQSLGALASYKTLSFTGEGATAEYAAH